MNTHCGNCGWVHFTRTLGEVHAEVNRFNAYYFTQPRPVQRHWSGPSSVESYMNCMRCGSSYLQFKKGTGGTDVYGSTINPILEIRPVHILRDGDNEEIFNGYRRMRNRRLVRVSGSETHYGQIYYIWMVK